MYALAVAKKLGNLYNFYKRFVYYLLSSSFSSSQAIVMDIVYKSYADLHFFQSLKYTRINLILDPSGMCWVGSYLLCLITALCTVQLKVCYDVVYTLKTFVLSHCR